MATLVLTTIGGAIGGPVGAAVGALVGQQIDARIFAPKPRHGPRLGELAVQTSSYGAAIPKLFGTMRVAGTVIWATDLKERRSSSGGGKGQPKTVNYSYSASFAVALSGRSIRTVRRIWADGKLLRGAAGDFKSRTRYRLYRGDEDQAPDRLIASAEGPGRAPAFRGIAYAMFEDFQLADYGNRIPSLTFEVEADPGQVAIGGIAQDLSDGEVVNGATPFVAGYAASGDSVRGAIEALSDVIPLSLLDKGDGVAVTAALPAPVTVSVAEAGAAGAGRTGGPTELVRRSAGSVPGEVSIAYYEPDRDYQTGLQRALRDGPSQRSDRRALPAAVSAEAAKGFAEYRLGAQWAARATAKLHLHWRRSGLRPGAQVLIDGEAGLWKVRRWTLDRMVVSLDLTRVQAGTFPGATAATPGRPVSEKDRAHGRTILRLLDLPLFDRLRLDRPQLLVAAGGGAGWRRADLTASYDGGSSWQAAGGTGGPAVMGRALNALGSAGSALFDAAGSLEVELFNEDLWLEGRSDAALVGGANLALVGSELIQFGRVETLGGGRFRLSRLLRGRRGTEWASKEHRADEDFVLVEAGALALVEAPSAATGSDVRVLASAVGEEDEPASASVALTGEALRPPSPVHLRAGRTSAGDLSISWVRRSRSGWDWGSGETPLGEESESYRLSLTAGGAARQVTVNSPSFVYPAAEQEVDGLAGKSIEVSVVQLGTSGASRAANIVIP